jgi:hypothetical protein
LKFAKFLPEFGWDVTVITARHEHYHARDESLLADIPDQARVIRVDAIDPAGLVRRQSDDSTDPSEPPSQAGFLRQVQQWARWPDDKLHFARVAARTARELAQDARFNAVYTTSPPPSIHYAGLTLQEDLGIPWVADFRDPWLVRADDWGPTVLHQRYARNLRTRILQRADHVLAMNDLVAEDFRASGLTAPLSIIPNGFDESDFGDTNESDGGTEFSIVYYGTISPTTTIRPFMDAATKWGKGHPGLPICITHIGHVMEQLEPEWEASGLLQRAGYLPHREAISELCGADAVVAALSPEPDLRMTIPGRVYELLRSLRPIIAYAPRDSAFADLVQTHDGVWICDPSEPTSALHALDEIYAREHASPARSVESVQQYDRRKQAAQLGDILNETVNAMGRARA